MNIELLFGGSVHWQAGFQTHRGAPGRQEHVVVPLGALRGSTAGRRVAGDPDWGKVCGMGLTVSTKREGAFAITVHSIAVS